MGWFIVAAILGFLSFWTWRTHIPPAAPQKSARTTSEFFVRSAYNVLVSFLPITLLIVLISIAVLKVILETLGQGHLLTQFADSLGHGTIARFLLGVVLGFGLAYVIEERSRVQAAQEHDSVGSHPPHHTLDPGSRSHQETTRRQNSDNPGHSEDSWSGVARVGASFLVAIGIAVTFLALAAPHIDRWLSHLTSVKLPFGELQVTSVSTHRGITADNTAFLTDTRSVEYLAAYNTKIQQDIDYIEKIEIEKAAGLLHSNDQQLAEKKQVLEAAKDLWYVFDKLISPVASCMRDALANGFSIDSARQLLRPLANTLDEIILVGDRFDEAELNAKHKLLWTQLLGIPENIKNFTNPKGSQCYGSAYVKASVDMEKPPIKGQPVLFPKIRNYKNLSYLHTAALLFTTFLKDDKVSLKILQKTQNDEPQFKDYLYLQWAAYITINQGSSLIVIASFLDKMREIAKLRHQTIQRIEHQCAAIIHTTNPCDEKLQKLIPELSKRERLVELSAMNNLAYYVAEGLARGEKAAEAYQGRAGDYANELLRAVELPAAAENRYLELDDDDRYNFLDTYAYVSIVLEARKPLPDDDKLKRMVVIFEKAVENAESQDLKALSVEPLNLYSKNVRRSHLATARELAGQ